jgi:hypothetical protein
VTKKAKRKLKTGKRKLTAAERRARRERRQKYMTIFLNGKQKRVPRPPTIDGMPIEEFIRRNADPIWLHQNELWEYLVPLEPDAEEWLDPNGTATRTNSSRGA